MAQVQHLSAGGERASSDGALSGSHLIRVVAINGRARYVKGAGRSELVPNPLARLGAGPGDPYWVGTAHEAFASKLIDGGLICQGNGEDTDINFAGYAS